MPKVSPEHLAARREQIVVAAMTCFSRGGFQRTTMADVIRESGLSAGAVYRYFTSKEELVAAIVQRVTDMFGNAVEELLTRTPDATPLAVLEHLIRTAREVALRGPNDLRRMALMAWGEALRNEEVEAIVRNGHLLLRSYFERSAERAVASGRLPAGAAPAAVAEALHSLLVGWAVQSLLIEELDVDRYLSGIRQLIGLAT